jgi:hypothetical protein
MQCFKKSEILKNGTILLPDYELELYLCDVSKPTKSDLITYGDFIKEVLVNIADWDNFIQKLLEDDYEKSNLEENNFKFSLSWVEISENKIILGYWGTEVNSQFNAIFTKSDDKWIMQKR